MSRIDELKVIIKAYFQHIYGSRWITYYSHIERIWESDIMIWADMGDDQVVAIPKEKK